MAVQSVAGRVRNWLPKKKSQHQPQQGKHRSAFEVLPTSPQELSRIAFLRWVAVAGIVLMGATRLLWFSPADFPVIPLVSICLPIPQFVDGAIWCLIMAGWVALAWLADRPVRRTIMFAIVTLLIGSMLLSTHRVQAWAWQFVWIGLFATLTRPHHWLAGWRAIVIAIYFYSAISKFDATFGIEQGPFIIHGLLRAAGVEFLIRILPNWLLFWASMVMPAVELLIAALLMQPTRWNEGRRLSYAVHAILCFSLGPWGQNHEWGVLLWNIFFIGQNRLLFEWSPKLRDERLTGAADYRKRLSPEHREPEYLSSDSITNAVNRSVKAQTHHSQEPANHETPQQFRARERIVYHTLVALTAALPALSFWGFYDHWPAWCLYSGRTERVVLQVRSNDVRKLPAGLIVANQVAEEGWRTVRLDRWSLALVHAPIYPQDRYQAGLALALLDRLGLKQVRLIHDGVPDRRTGKRNRRIYSKRDDIAKLAASFWWNTKSR